MYFIVVDRSLGGVASEWKTSSGFVALPTHLILAIRNVRRRSEGHVQRDPAIYPYG